MKDRTASTLVVTVLCVLLFIACIAMAVITTGCRSTNVNSPRLTYAPEIEIEGGCSPAAAAAIGAAVGQDAMKRMGATTSMHNSDVTTTQAKTTGVDTLTDPTMAASQNGDANASREGDSNELEPIPLPEPVTPVDSD